MSTEAANLYTKAFQLHYSSNADSNSIDGAARLYLEIVKRFPSSTEAQNANAQLQILRGEQPRSSSISVGDANRRRPLTSPVAIAAKQSPAPSPLMNIDAPGAYKIAYDAHWKQKDYSRAKSLYEDIIARFPKSDEARYARSQLENIASAQNAPNASTSTSSGHTSPRRNSATSIYATTLQQVTEQSRLEAKKLDDLRSMVTTSASIVEPHKVVRPIRVIVPVMSKSDIDTSKARLTAFDTAIIWLAQKAVEHGGNMVLAATFEEVAAETRTDDRGRVHRCKIEIVATGTCVKIL